jgi:hypothetical protein
MKQSAVSFYVDTLIAETILQDHPIQKTAGELSNLLSMVGSYFSAHVDPNDKAGSVLNMLAPGTIWSTLSSIGLGRWGLALGAAAAMLHLDISGMLSSIWGNIRSMLSGGHPISSDHVDAAVQSAVQEHAPQDAQHANTLSINSSLREAKIFRLAMDEYEKQLFRLTKEGSNNEEWLAAFGQKKPPTASLLGKLIGWVFKVALASAGLMVAGDVANKFLGRPNAIDHTYQAGKTPADTSAPASTTSQTKFKLNPSFQNTPEPRPWGVQITNDPGSIENMLVNFTKDVYSGLDGKEEVIRSSPLFQAVKNQIVWYNHKAEGEPTVYIPQIYTNKKSIADNYIDQVAKNAT